MVLHFSEGICHICRCIVRFAQPCSQDLHDIVSSKEAGRDYIVIDVRDDDFAGGHVKGCLRAPFQQYEDGLSQLVFRVKDIPIVIFHCTLSQVR